MVAETSRFIIITVSFVQLEAQPLPPCGTHLLQVPPVQALRRHGVRIALATDCNPGTSPLLSILMAMNLGLALDDMAVAPELLRRAREAGLATWLPL